MALSMGRLTNKRPTQAVAQLVRRGPPAPDKKQQERTAIRSWIDMYELVRITSHVEIIEPRQSAPGQNSGHRADP